MIYNNSIETHTLKYIKKPICTFFSIFTFLHLRKWPLNLEGDETILSENRKESNFLKKQGTF